MSTYRMQSGVASATIMTVRRLRQMWKFGELPDEEQVFSDLFEPCPPRSKLTEVQ